MYLASKDHPQFLAYVQEKMLIPWCVLTTYFLCQEKKKEKKREAGGQVYLSKAAEKHDLLSSLVSVFQSVVHAEVRVLPVGLSGRASAPARPLSFPRSRHLLEPHQLKF